LKKLKFFTLHNVSWFFGWRNLWSLNINFYGYWRFGFDVSLWLSYSFIGNFFLNGFLFIFFVSVLVWTSWSFLKRLRRFWLLLLWLLRFFLLLNWFLNRCCFFSILICWINLFNHSVWGTRCFYWSCLSSWIINLKCSYSLWLKSHIQWVLIFWFTKFLGQTFNVISDSFPSKTSLRKHCSSCSMSNSLLSYLNIGWINASSTVRWSIELLGKPDYINIIDIFKPVVKSIR